MKDEIKTKKQLIEELWSLREQVRPFESGVDSSELEENFKKVVETMSDVVFEMDLDLNCTYVTPSIMGLSGYTPEEFLSVPTSKTLTPDSWQRAREFLADGLQGEKPAAFNPIPHRTLELEYFRKDGTTAWGETRVSFVKDLSRNTVGIRGVIRDISERKAAETALKNSEKKYRALVDTMNDGIASVDMEGTVTFVNEALTRVLGYSAGEMIGVKAGCFMDDENLVVLTRNMQLRREGGTNPYELVLRKKHGEEVTFLLTPSPIFDDDGNLAGSFGVLKDITERKNAERKIRESEELLSGFLDSATDIVILLDKDLVVRDLNQAASKVWQHLLGESGFKGRSVLDIFDPQKDVETRVQGYKNVIRTGHPRRFQNIEFIGPKGTRYFDVRAFKVGDGLGIIATDNTDLRVMENALKESEERLRLMVESTEDLFFMQDRDGRYLYASGSEKYGVPEESLTGKVPHDLHDKETADRMVERVQMVMDSGESLTEETAFIWNGEKIYFLDTISPVRDRTGKIIAATTISKNTTLIKEAEIAVLESERHYRGLVEGTDDLITIVDADGVIIFTNHSSERIFGHRSDKCVGRLAFDFIHADDREKTRNWFLKCCEESLETSTIENRQVNQTSGQVFNVHWHCNFQYDMKGNLIDVVSVARDLTEYKKLELQLLHSEKLESLGVLAGGIAHDFNNLLMGILGNVGLAQMKIPAESPIHSELKKVEKTARIAADLTNQLLAFSGRGSLDVKQIDLSELVRHMDQLLKTAISGKAKVIYEIAQNVPVIEADASQVQQVIMNLMTNASDALGGSTGNIRCATGAADLSTSDLADLYMHEGMTPGVYTFLEVADTGSGMDQKTFKKLFEPFYTTKNGGRGLGLASVLGIMKSLGGGLALSSTIGKGSSFRAYFPITENPADNVPADVKTHSDWCASGTVLVVDDEETVRAVTKEILEDRGFSVMTASNGKEGFKIFESCKVEICLIIMDLTMPVMDGGEALGRIRESSEAVPVLIISGFTELDSMKGVIEKDEKVSFLQKPFMPDELIGKVSRMLEKIDST